MAPSNDPKVLAPAPVRSSIVDANGVMTFEWSRWFQNLYQRIGGGSTDPLDQVNQKITDLTTRVTNAEASISTINGEVATINGEITVVQADLALLETRVSAIEAQLTAGFNGTIVTAALTLAGTQGSMTFNQGILTNSVQAT